MKKKGFASIYIFYSFFLMFIMLMLTTLGINMYKQKFLNTLKNDIKNDIQNYHLNKIDSVEEKTS